MSYLNDRRPPKFSVGRGGCAALLAVSVCLGCSDDGPVVSDGSCCDSAAVDSAAVDAVVTHDAAVADVLSDSLVVEDGRPAEVGVLDFALIFDNGSSDFLSDGPALEAGSMVDAPISDGLGGLPDLYAGLPVGDCESSLANNGAREHWLGQLSWIDATTASGYEERLWFLNSKWKSIGGTDCIARWNTTATKGAPVNCSSCDLSLTVSGQINLAKSTCDPASWKGDETFTATYDVQLNANGTSDWLFANTGNSLGTGYWNTAALNYLSPGACKWF